MTISDQLDNPEENVEWQDKEILTFGSKGEVRKQVVDQQILIYESIS
jgi:hypothetical protein